MRVISSKEFNANQEMYFDMAVNEEVCIKRDTGMYRLMYSPLELKYPEQEILEPDEDFYNAISGDEFKKRALEIVEKVHNQYYLNK